VTSSEPLNNWRVLFRIMIAFSRSLSETSFLTLGRPLLPYGHSYKASCTRPG